MHKERNFDGNTGVYDVPRWDSYNWRQFLTGSPQTQTLVEKGKDALYSFPTFVKETFHRLFNSNPRQNSKIRPEQKWALKAHEQMEQVTDFQRLKQRCKADRFLSGVAATAFSEQMLEELPKPKDTLTDPQPIRSQVRGLKALQRRSHDDGKAIPLEVSDLLETLVEQGKSAVESALDFADDIDDSTLRHCIRASCEVAQQEVQRISDEVEAFSFGDHSGRGEGVDNLEEKLALAETLRRSEKLRRIAMEAGRLRRIARKKQRNKADQARSEVSSIGPGDSLSHLLPFELLKLSSPDLFSLFAKGFTEKALMQYQLSGKERVGRGPIVVCLDSSGSMEGEREVWSKAVALALLDIALSQRRSCRIIHFDATVRRIDDFTEGKVHTPALLASMKELWGGGTNFERPLHSALEAIEREKEFKKSDVIFITDGECSLEESFVEEWLESMNRLDFSVYSVLIGATSHNELDRVSSQSLYLSDLSKDSVVLDSILTI